MNAAEPWNTPNAKIGVGAFICDGNRVLLVQVNYGPAKGAWILPGGRVENSESLSEALIREVQEETGFQVRFEGILGFRQRLGSVMDIYFICDCALVPGQENHQPASSDAGEITSVKFWPLTEALASTEVRPNTKKAIQMGVQRRAFLKPLVLPDIPTGEFLFS